MKALLFLLGLAGVLFVCSGKAQERPRIMVITHGQSSDPFWLVVRNGVAAAARDTGSDVDYRAPEHFDVGALPKLIEQAIAVHPAGLIVSIPDEHVLVQPIKEAVAAKIPVIVINCGFAIYRQLGCLMYVGQEEDLAGKQAGERLKAMGIKRLLVLNQESGNAGLEQRVGGIREGFEGPFHHVEVMAVNAAFGPCHDAVSLYLQGNPDIDGVIALGPVAAEPALQVLEELDRFGQTKLCCFDISPAVVQALIHQRMGFAVDQQQWLQGYLPVMVLANWTKFGCLPQLDLMLTGPTFITPENAGRMVNPLSMGFH